MKQEVVLNPQQKTTSSSGREFNFSTYFLLPIVIKEGRRYTNLINTYLYNLTNEVDTDGKTMLYVETKAIDYNLNTSKYYIADSKTENNTHLYTFDISSYKSDVELFIQGKYSMFSQELKDDLCRKEQLALGTMFTDIYKILYRTDDKRKRVEAMIGQKLHEDAELCSSCNIEEEIRV